MLLLFQHKKNIQSKVQSLLRNARYCFWKALQIVRQLRHILSIVLYTSAPDFFDLSWNPSDSTGAQIGRIKVQKKQIILT